MGHVTVSHAAIDTEVGFVGLGNMGLPMARNLLDAGVNVSGFDLDTDRLEKFEQAGGDPAADLTGIADCEIVMVSLRSPDQVRQVSDELFGNMDPDSIFVDMSTIDPLTTKQIAEIGEDNGISVVDAPVSGGVVGAEEGTLSIIVGGDDDDIAAVRELFEVLAEDVFHVGSTGAGQTVKLANQILIGAQAAIVGEAFRFGEANGIDSAVLYDVLSKSAGSSWILEEKGRRIVEDDFEPGFDINLQYKDLKLSQEVAQELDVPMYMLSTAVEEYVQARREGLGNQDHTAMYKLFND
ncbi:NAD(P)-dependent oxidoreductase [Halorussus sp. AFM4]|uniref:NAD(P)-dependent oxidoreductase n=1 Tax=Halorussus sp. AFM4 TaxID=3421651 RepID=UPI003EBC9239